MNNLTYKDWFNTDQKIKLQEELSASINSNWDVFFTTQYQSYVTSSLSSSLKVFKSFSDEFYTDKIYL
jgi:hypothetical protein